ncbi:MAG: hypothetical protein KBS86_02205 [Proteobacteria bacterium]|nr:hypothetical protein [Candidatus Enterousia scatequi]
MRKIQLFLLCVLLSVNSFADGIITQNIINGCDVDNLKPADNETFMIAHWQINSYTCAPGYYLPANAIECVKCLSDHTCPGGTYTFNENKSQGIIFNSILTTDFAGGCVNDYLIGSPVKTYAKWERNSYDCSAGYYLPADGVECVVCPNNNYCPGGKYEYSETVTQGIMECPNNLFSPSGVFEIESCGRKLHIGDETLYLRGSKQTTPSLNVDINNDGIADFFGNATLQRTTINSSSQRYLHIGEYYIYDDSVKLNE